MTPRPSPWFSLNRFSSSTYGFVLSAALLPALGLYGCASKDTKPDNLEALQGQTAEVFGEPRPGAAQAPGARTGRHAMPWELGEAQPDAGPSKWVIAVAMFSPDQGAEARRALALARDQGKLPSATLVQRRLGWVVAFGSYDSPDAPQAQRDLAMVKSREVDGARPFATAALLPPEARAVAGAIAELDLRRAREVFGKQAAYTLQVGAYARADNRPASADELAQFRALAEQAAQELRRQGEMAFYYHGPRMSLVTVGLFADEDLAGVDRDAAGGEAPRAESMALQEARRKFPHTLLNGKGVVLRQRGGDGSQRLAPAELVRVPER